MSAKHRGRKRRRHANMCRPGALTSARCESCGGLLSNYPGREGCTRPMEHFRQSRAHVDRKRKVRT